MTEPAEKLVVESDEDRELRAIIETGEAGVADLIAVYEGIESRYFAALNATAVSSPVVAYATHT